MIPRYKGPSSLVHTFFSEIYDSDNPPLYKHYLRIEADTRQLTITCYAVSGDEGEEAEPKVEERFTIPLLRIDHADG